MRAPAIVLCLAASMNVGFVPPPEAAPQILSAPGLLKPANGASPAQPITFDWTDVANAAGYTFQADDSIEFTAPLVQEHIVVTSELIASGFPALPLWWRVRAMSAAGTPGPWSLVRSFQPRAVNPAAVPATPLLSSVTVSPVAAGGTGGVGTITLSAPAPPGGMLVSLTSSNPGVAAIPATVLVPAGATTGTFPITTTAGATTPVDISASYGDITRSVTMTTVPPLAGTPLPPPALVSPGHGAHVTAGQGVSFDWTDVPGAVSYTIQIDDAQVFAAPLVLTETVKVSQFTTNTLPAGRLYWRVRATNAFSVAGTWSTVRSLEVR
jgi:hypothetical protein